MTAVAVPLTLLDRLLGVLVDNLSSQGHAYQFVTQEGRGACPPAGHSPRCLEYRALLVELSEVIQAADPPAEVQLPLVEMTT